MEKETDGMDRNRNRDNIYGGREYTEKKKIYLKGKKLYNLFFFALRISRYLLPSLPKIAILKMRYVEEGEIYGEEGRGKEEEEGENENENENEEERGTI